MKFAIISLIFLIAISQ